ncbi:MAG: PleD family two-component system response regulator [Anaerolineales bacterium]
MTKEPKRANILVVDDDEAFGKATSDILRHHGYETRTATSAAQALMALEKMTPDLMLIDIMMPEVDGLSLIKLLARNPKMLYTPMVVVSAKAQDSDIGEAWWAGAEGYLTKPFTSQELLQRVDHMLSQLPQ